MGNDDNGSNSGSAYVFHGLSDCQPNGVLDTCDITDGMSDDDNGNGVPDECEEVCQANELAKLLPSDGAAGDYFGDAVAISAATVFIGAPYDDDHGADSGSTYVFRYDGLDWVQEAKLLASDGAAGDRFGGSVAVSGDTALIGASRDDDNGEDSGAVYVFRYNGSSWVQEAKLLASDGAAGDRFGNSVAIAGEVVLVGAYWDDDYGSDSGTTYVFRYNGSDWLEEAKLLPSDGAAGDWFGRSVAISGDTVLIGAYYDDNENGSDAGAAYVFHYDGSDWVQEAKLLASDGAPADKFAHSVALFADTALVGAQWDDDHGASSGSAYVFRYNGSDWLEEAKLLASDGTPQDEFGWWVAISGDTAVIGALFQGDDGDQRGSAYVFQFDGSHWFEEAKLQASDGADGDMFSRSLAVSGGIAVIGASWDDGRSGSAYVFHGLSDCNSNERLDICDITNGTSEDANGNGVPDECEGPECPGDLDGDSDIDLADLAQLLAHYGMTSGATYWDGDLDGDGDVDLSDLAALLAVYGTTCE